MLNDVRKGSLKETGYDQFKKYMPNRTHQHRSFKSIITNLLSGQLAYSYFPKKPSINVDFENNSLVA